MFNTNTLLGFIIASIVVLVIPGPGVVYVVARSVGQGFRAGLASAIGLSAGAFVHVVAATLGLSAVLSTSATAFTIVKSFGAAYLIYLGIKTLLSKNEQNSEQSTSQTPMSKLIIDGVVISVFNPKIAVFFLAFLPQFIDPNKGPIPQQVLFLGLIYVCLAVLSDGTYAFVASKARGLFTGRVMRSNFPRYTSGSIYIALGINTALIGRNS